MTVISKLNKHDIYYTYNILITCPAGKVITKKH